MMRPTALALAALAVVLGDADAGVLCQKKSGVVTLRATSCAKKETPVDLAQLGLVGPPGQKGDPGLGGGLRAYAHVAAGAGTALAASGIAGVAHPVTGIYCLTPAAGLDNGAPALVTPDAGQSTGTSLLAWTQTPPSSCPSTDFEVQTLDLTESPSDAVGFVFAVP